MHGFDNFRFWQQRREELFREAEIERLAREVRSDQDRKARPLPALGWELQRYGGRVSKLFRTLIHTIYKV